MDCKTLNIAVVCGGVSSEREVSLRSGKAVFDALRAGGFSNVTLFDLTKESMPDLLRSNIDIAYLALHGKGGEDGCIQGMLELAGITYTGSRVQASANCMDKIRTKELLLTYGLPTPKYLKLCKNDLCNKEQVQDRIVCELGLPVVLKSPCEGSSIGVFIVRDRSELGKYVDEIFTYGDTLLAEEYVEGVEVTLPILGNTELTVLPCIEITSENEFYDFEAKYTAGMCHHILPARISESDAAEVSELGSAAYRALGCAGLSRIDFIIDKNKGPMIIEINTLPGMTEMSLFPDSARYAGISFPELTERVVRLAMENFSYEEKNK